MSCTCKKWTTGSLIQDWQARALPGVKARIEAGKPVDMTELLTQASRVASIEQDGLSAGVPGFHHRTDCPLHVDTMSSED